MTRSNETVMICGAVGAVSLIGLGATVLIPFTTPPAPHRATGIFFGPGFDDRSSLATLTSAAPSAKILDVRWHGRLIYVVYDDVGTPTALKRAGALYVFDAVAAGCHGAPSKPWPKT